MPMQNKIIFTKEKIMEQLKKRLKIDSILVLALAATTLINVVAELLLWNTEDFVLPDGSPDNILLITQILVLAISALILLPQVYIGIKGLCIVKKPNASRGHIVWATILLVFAAISALSPVLNIITMSDVGGNASLLLSTAVDIIIYWDYVKHAKAIAKEA
jgi:hypothetical protein